MLELLLELEFRFQLGLGLGLELTKVPFFMKLDHEQKVS